MDARVHVAVDPDPELTEAVRLAFAITQYWTKRGYAVKVTVTPMQMGSGEHGRIYAIRSDMIGGRPRDWIAF